MCHKTLSFQYTGCERLVPANQQLLFFKHVDISTKVPFHVKIFSFFFFPMKLSKIWAKFLTIHVYIDLSTYF